MKNLKNYIRLQLKGSPNCWSVRPTFVIINNSFDIWKNK
jgi:hypothetical protein